MADVTLDLGEWNELTEDIKKLLKGQEGGKIIYKAVEAAGVKLDRIARDTYPPEKRRLKASSRWTDKQRRWWWWIMGMKAQGKMQHMLPGWKAQYVTANGRKTLQLSGEYKRSGTIVRSLTYDVQQERYAGDWLTWLEYGTNTKGAEFVIDEDKQSWYHKGNWTTLQDLAQNNDTQLQMAFFGKLVDGIEDYWRKL